MCLIFPQLLLLIHISGFGYNSLTKNNEFNCPQANENRISVHVNVTRVECEWSCSKHFACEFFSFAMTGGCELFKSCIETMQQANNTEVSIFQKLEEGK